MDVPELVASDDGLWISVDPDQAGPIFYQRCRADQAARAIRRLRPLNILTQQEVVVRPAWLDLPSTYIVCTHDRALSPAYQMERAERLGDYAVIETDHSAFYSATTTLVEQLDVLARRLAGTEAYRSG